MAMPLLLAEQTGSTLNGLLPIILVVAVMYFVVLGPMRKQEKDRKKRVEGLKKGDQVVIGGGIFGRISNLDDPKVALIEIADKVKVRVLRKDIVDAGDFAIKDAPGDKKAEPKDKGDDKDGDAGKTTGANAE